MGMQRELSQADPTGNCSGRDDANVIGRTVHQRRVHPCTPTGSAVGPTAVATCWLPSLLPGLMQFFVSFCVPDATAVDRKLTVPRGLCLAVVEIDCFCGPQIVAVPSSARLNRKSRKP